MSTNNRPSGGYRLVETLLESQTGARDARHRTDSDGQPPIAEPVVIARMTRVSIVENAAGRRAAVCKEAALMQLYRASGRMCTFWTTDRVRTVYRTQTGMVIGQTSSGKGGRRAATAERLFGTDARSAADIVQYVFDDTLSDRFRNHALASEAERETIGKRVLETTGPAPIAAQRFPLLACADSAGFAVKLNDMLWASAVYQDPWLDCVDAAQVARRLFGARHYRRPLAQQVARCNNRTLLWYSLFRGLVPPEWIIDALRAIPDEEAPEPHEMSGREWRALRAVLRETPRPVLRRMLAEPVIPMTTALRDTARQITAGPVQRRPIDTIVAVINATGQRNIRSSRDLHNLVMRVPNDPRRRGASNRSESASHVLHRERNLVPDFNRVNHHRTNTAPAETEVGTVIEWEQWLALTPRQRDELIDTARQWEDEQYAHDAALRRREDAEYEQHAAELAQENHRQRVAANAQRAQWAMEVTAKITTAGPLGGLTAVVATDGQQLRDWGARMRNCIGDYEGQIGLDILLALYRGGELVANAEITKEAGLVQLLGRYNYGFAELKDLGADLGRAVLADLSKLGITADPHGWGLTGLLPPPGASQEVA